MTVEQWPHNNPRRPAIVCLCGSSRFYAEFQRANHELTMAGQIVLSIGFMPGDDHGEAVGCTPEQKAMLDELHLCKIHLADEVFILNVDGYVGWSTRRELAYALQCNKTIRWLDPVRGEAYLNEWGPVLAEVAQVFPVDSMEGSSRFMVRRRLRPESSSMENFMAAWADADRNLRIEDAP